MTNHPNRTHVPVKTFIDGDTYRQLLAHADARGITVSVLLARLAAASIKPKRRHVRITPAMLDEARGLLDRGYSMYEVSARLGASRAGIRRALARPEVSA